MTKKDPDKVQIHPAVRKTDISIPQHLEMIDANLAEHFGVEPGTPREQIANLLEARDAERSGDYQMLRYRLIVAIQRIVVIRQIETRQLHLTMGVEEVTDSLTFAQIEKFLVALLDILKEEEGYDNLHEIVAEKLGFPAEKYDEMEASIGKGIEWEKGNK